MTVSYRQKAHELVDQLPDATVIDLLTWMQSKRARQQKSGEQTPLFTPVAMGGLWKGIRISDADIADVRQQMSAGFGETSG